MTGPLTRPIVEAFEALSPQLQTAARYVLDRPDDVALLSMREQARRAGVPPATMTRLAQRLGLEGYDEVRALYAGAVRDGTLGFAGKAGVQVEAQKLRGDQALASDMVQSLGRQIARLAEPAALGRLANAAGRLHEARRIYCVGLRSCHAAAWHFHYVLSLLGDRTVMLDDAGGTAFDALRHAGREDILLAASVEPHARAGLFQAIELGEDRMTKAPFDPARKLHAKVRKAAMARGLMVYPMGGTIDGQRGDHVLLAPPFIVTADQIDEIVDRLGSAVDDALA